MPLPGTPLSGLPDDAATGWDRDQQELLMDVVERGNSRSWRFLEATGTLDRALPELARAVHRRRNDPMELDLDGAYRFRRGRRPEGAQDVTAPDRLCRFRQLRILTPLPAAHPRRRCGPGGPFEAGGPFGHGRLGFESGDLAGQVLHLPP